MTLNLTGHVRNRPKQKISAYYSYPNGMSAERYEDIISQFNRAYVFESLQLN